MDETLGTVLRRLRHERSLTLEEVAEATGISVAMLSRAEREQRVPSTEVVATLSEYYRVPVEVLERYAAELHYRSRSNPRSGSRPPLAASEASFARSETMRSWETPGSEPPWFDEQHSPGPMRESQSPGRSDHAWLMASAPDVGDQTSATDSLRDAAHMAEVALEIALRSAERARASGDPAQVAEAERVIARLRRIIDADTRR